ncbi:MAG: L,D-transpeptidase [Pseudomonadota bacterium]
MRRRIVVIVAGALLWSVPCFAQSSGTFVEDLLSSLALRDEAPERRVPWGETIDRLISTPSWASEDQGGGDRSGGQGENVSPPVPASEDQRPGTGSRDSSRTDLVRVASLPPETRAALMNDAPALDVSEKIASLNDPGSGGSGLYSRLEIQVERKVHTLRLFGVKRDGGREVLFTCKTGLGSDEYPTPQGSYFILRIFDDKPLWIPPPDRPWAWGQSASHSVYGGHMMPFFTKKPLPRQQTAEVINQLDCITDQRQMVDAGAYRIHGTNSAWSVGYNQSHGCVRLLNKSVKELSDLIKLHVGTTMRGSTANGSFVQLARPVRLILF